MLSWFNALMPKEEGFFLLFNRHAETLVAGAKALRGVLEGGPEAARYCELVNAEEDKADQITREALNAVRRTFITPFDRSDITELVTLMDDAIDQMKKTAKVVTLFEVKDFPPIAREMGDVVVQAAELTAQAVALLNKLEKNSAQLNDLAERITQLEEKSDSLYDAGRIALYRENKGGDALAFIVGVDLYSHIEKVVDHLEDVANKISGILIEHL